MIGVASAGGAFERNDDVCPTGGEGRQDLAFGFERGCVGIGVDDVDGAAGEEAMAIGGAARVQPEYGDRDDLGPVQCHQAMRRTDKFLVVVVLASAGVAHYLGYRPVCPGPRPASLRGRHAKSRRERFGRKTLSRPCRRSCVPALSTRRRECRVDANLRTSASVGLPSAPYATLTGISFSCWSLAGASASTRVMDTARAARRGIRRPPRYRRTRVPSP